MSTVNIPLPTRSSQPTNPGMGGWFSYGGAWWPYPTWYDCDFAFLAGIRPVVACVPQADNGVAGQLQVWRYDGSSPPNADPTTKVVVETQDVYNCTLLARKDGTLDLFYLRTVDYPKVSWRMSRDEGRTWSARVRYDFGFDLVSLVPSYGQTGGGHALPMCHLHSKGLVVGVISASKSGGSVSGLWVLIGKLKDTNDGWTWNTGTLLGAFSPSIIGIGNLVETSDGRVRFAPGPGGLLVVKADGTVQQFSEPRNSGMVYPAPPIGWLYEHRALAFGMSPNTAPDPSVSGANKMREYWGWTAMQMDASRVWQALGPQSGALSSQSAYPFGFPNDLAHDNYDKGIRGWSFDPLINDVVQNGTSDTTAPAVYTSRAGMLKLDPTARFWFLRANPQGELEFARCSDIPQSLLAVWEGR